jgi:hypothetical protein
LTKPLAKLKRTIEMKPKLFIGSSTEGRPIAEAIHSELQSETQCTIWTHGVFGLSNSNIESLMRQVDTSDFAVFVFSADDAVIVRGQLFPAPRDNVVYELGLFSGVLGPERCFFVTPGDIHLPTDLLGITAGWYETGRTDDNWQAAVGPFCTKVRSKIRELTLRPDNRWRRVTRLALEVLAPTDGAVVELTRTVRGSTTHPTAPLQVLVFARDSKWHPQRAVIFDGRAWSAECQFGNVERGRGEQYRIVAISTDQPLRAPVGDLPTNCIKSQIVTVVRSAV